MSQSLYDADTLVLGGTSSFDEMTESFFRDSHEFDMAQLAASRDDDQFQFHAAQLSPAASRADDTANHDSFIDQVDDAVNFVQQPSPVGHDTWGNGGDLSIGAPLFDVDVPGNFLKLPTLPPTNDSSNADRQCMASVTDAQGVSLEATPVPSGERAQPSKKRKAAEDDEGCATVVPRKPKYRRRKQELMAMLERLAESGWLTALHLTTEGNVMRVEFESARFEDAIEELNACVECRKKQPAQRGVPKENVREFFRSQGVVPQGTRGAQHRGWASSLVWSSEAW